ncbi:MAG: DMT family transporter [Deltaproteobacteria bacterium]|jgi:drug/metabolite transporter (DMT)-like permease|nr:DMT family transporter [Deltaproteobacteria bacterium]MBT4641137.1 DMT family transporter [Deltaproteobacteria bacterium]MBT6504981.1 DMT family transporter [Deltaproteobacteria bacterium]MBT7153964.1 DMT family transporter [Deltaproteobacteria bacterium]MBT7712155.1 DMT family transporter [Deltaproteobacteria bacterium]
MHYLIFIIISLVWGGGFFLMKIAGLAFGPLTIAAGSTFGGSVVLWIFWALAREKWRIRRQHLLPLLLVSVFSYMWPYSAQPFLVNQIGHGFVGMMVSLVPVLTIIVSIPMLGLFPSRTQLAGVLVGMFCIVLMVIDGLNRTAQPLFLVVAISVPLCYAISNTMIQKSFQEIPPVLLAAFFMTAATAFLTPLSMVIEEVTFDRNFLTAMAAMLLLSVFARGIGMLLFYKLIKQKGPLFAGMVTYVIPLEALMWSWFDNERITLMQISAIIIVLLMVGIVQRDIIQRGKKQAQTG